MAQLGPVAHRGVDVDDRRLADHRVLPDGDRADLDEPGVCSIAVDEGVFADHRAIADAEQVGADGHVRGEDHHAAPDLRAQRPQIEVEQRRTGEQHNRVPPHQRLDDPEPDVRQAPDADLLGLPATDQDPLRQDRNGEQEQEQCAAGNDRPEVDVEHTSARRNPLIALSDDQRGQIGISEEDQQLQRPAEHHLRCSCRCGHLDGGCSWCGHLDRGRSRRLDRNRCGVRECRRQAFDRGVLVNVLDRHRWQIRPLPDPGTEPGHHHRVRTQIIEEVAVHRHPLYAHYISQHVGEDPLDRHRRGVRECRGQAFDRGVLVNVLDRHRRQIRPLPDPGTEPGHHHRIRTKIIEEVAVHRHPLHLHDVGQHLGEGALGARLRASATALSARRISQTDCQGIESFLHHVSYPEAVVSSSDLSTSSPYRSCTQLEW